MGADMRASFGGKLVAILAAAGSAIGLGSIWRFPYVAGENGGAAFLLVYLLAIFVVGIPVMVAEFAVGRSTKKNAVGGYRQLAKGWRWLGYSGIVAALFISGYYYIIAGWSLEYFVGSFGSLYDDGVNFSAQFGAFQTSWRPLIYMVIFVVLTHIIIARGVQDGIEKASKVMMPMLFVMVLAIAVYSLTLPGAGKGVDYLFNPDFSKIDGKACAAALGQAFFSLSLGFGTIMTYASYVDKKENPLFQSTATAVSDLMFALIAGVAIMPAVFAFGLNPQSGPGLVFETLPYVFSQMPAGGIIAIVFFIALLVAALTSSISMLEVAVAYLVEEKGFTRIRSCIVLFAACWAVGALCSLSFGPLSDVKIAGSSIFDFFDSLSSNVLMTLGSLLTVLFVGWSLKKTDIYDEFTNGGSLSTNVKIFGILWFLIRYVCPLAIIFIFISGLM